MIYFFSVLKSFVFLFIMAAPKGNKYALGLTNNGRPPLYDNPTDLEVKCIEYFEECYNNGDKATITGLALFLGFESRQSLYDYKEKEDFAYILKRATLAVENSYETGGTAFDIFALKNMGWKDKSETELSGGIQQNIVNLGSGVKPPENE